MGLSGVGGEDTWYKRVIDQASRGSLAVLVDNTTATNQLTFLSASNVTDPAPSVFCVLA